MSVVHVMRISTMALLTSVFVLATPGMHSAEAQNISRSKEIVKKLLGKKKSSNNHQVERKATSRIKENGSTKRTRNVRRNIDDVLKDAQKKIARIKKKSKKKNSGTTTFAAPLNPPTNGNRNSGTKLKKKTRTVRALPLDPNKIGNRGGTRVVRAAPRNPDSTGNRRPTAAPFNPPAKAGQSGETKTLFAKRHNPTVNGKRVVRRQPVAGGTAGASALVSTRTASPFGGGRQIVGRGTVTRAPQLSVASNDQDVEYVEVDDDLSIDLTVHFDFGSADITPQARPALHELAIALLDPELVNSRILIAGHTDAVGSNESNMVLSNRRALSIRDHLVLEYAIDPYRLEIVGYGEEDPVIVEDPYDGRNRRVQIFNLGETSF